MGPNGKDAGSRDLRVALLHGSETRTPGDEPTPAGAELVFDFTGLSRPGLCDLSLILTARLQASAAERVWVRALPEGTWTILRGLGLDHLFHVLPGPGAVRD